MFTRGNHRAIHRHLEPGSRTRARLHRTTDSSFRAPTPRSPGPSGSLFTDAGLDSLNPEASPATGRDETHPVVFFDGECVLCHRGVRLLAARDPRARLRFAPLEGEFARDSLPPALRDAGPDGTVVLLEPGGRTSVRAEAVLRALAATGGPWTLAGAIARSRTLVSLLDVAYRALARRRERWFGRTTECPIPDPSMRERLLP